MQDQFDRENKEQTEIPFEEENVQNTNDTQFTPAPSEEERMQKEESRKKLRFAANRIGWATVVLVAIWMAILIGFSVLMYAIDGIIDGVEFTLFYQKYYIVINEVALALSIAVASLILRSVPKIDFQRETISVGRFLKLLVMCFGAGYIGNRIGTTILSYWNNATGNSVGDELTSILSETSPLLMFISVGILAPILEELFFRKFLTERLRGFGELTAIVIPAFLFALFHQSASQFIYAFMIGILIGYFYCRTGNYWLTVLIHGVFNTISGVIPILYLPRVMEFLNEMQKILSADLNADSNMLAEQLISLLGEHGLALALFVLHSIFVFAINITGVILLVINFKKFKERKEEYSLSFEESFNIIFKTPGIFVCTILLSIMTILSLFA